MQSDLEAYLKIYNTKRPHRGRGMEGRTPYTVFKARKPKTKRTWKTHSNKEDLSPRSIRAGCRQSFRRLLHGTSTIR